MDSLRRWFASFLTFWGSLKLWQRASIITAIFVVLGGLGALIFMTGNTSYEPLYAGLDVSDQAAIVDYLKENNIPYRLDPNASAILMPGGAIYETRLTLAQMGLPKGGTTGFEIFDDSSMGMSEFQQRIAYMRAIEGELARTISQMSQVENARVSVVIPEQRLFLEQQKPSTASVLLRLRPGATIGPTQVKSIIHLVAHSVDGLEPDAVTVVDTNGRILSDMVSDSMIIYNPDGTNSVTSVQRELERQHERELENKVRVMLEQVYGPGTAVVRVRIDLDFDKRTSSFVEYSPNPETGTGVPRSNERQEESYTGQGNPVNGNPGTTTNIPGYAINSTQVNSEYNRTNATTNYEITTRKGDQVVTPGGVRRLSASVLIDDKYNEITEERLEALQEVISSAIGFNKERGDSLVVHAMRFSTAFADSMADQMRQDRMWRIIYGAVAAAMILLIALGALYAWIRTKRARLAVEEIEAEGKKVPTIQEMLTSPDLLAFQGEMAVLEEQLKAYAKSHPEEIATLVNEWLSMDS
ncbi:MAG: flagellar M-ring protein FliF [Synergistaceae bacterium]|nr:flagellar M-ring protein FliF [Synergistaceae bacterium]MBQ6969851.1 flagellar M-ring protein FliF [Synergistaceae bacterium]